MTQNPFPDQFAHLSDTDYIFAIIASQMGERPATPSTTANHAQPLPHTPSFDHLRSHMQKDTQEYLVHLTRDLRTRLFILLPRQFQTLTTLDVPRHLLDQLASLTFLKLRSAPYPVQDRLQTIAAVPNPTGPLQPPDWRRWWWDHREQRIGVHRPWDHNPQADPVSEDLNQVITAIANEAANHLPHPHEIHPLIKTKSNASPTLSQVYAALSDIHQTGLRMLLPPERLTILRMGNPDAVLKDLRDHSLPVQQDMGNITTLQALKPLLPPRGRLQDTRIHTSPDLVRLDRPRELQTHPRRQHLLHPPTHHLHPHPRPHTPSTLGRRSPPHTPHRSRHSNPQPRRLLQSRRLLTPTIRR